MSEFRIPVLVGGPLAGRQAPEEWTNRENEPGTSAEFAYLTPEERGFEDVPIPIDLGTVHTYEEHQVTMGSEPGGITGLPRGGTKVRGLVFKPHGENVRSVGHQLVKALVLLASQSPPARVSEPSSVTLFGYPAHLILTNGPDQVEVKDWLLTQGSDGAPFIAPGVNLSKVADAVHAEELAGRWR